ncbi:MAG TPA: 4-hydroxy-tetrahydrodipicolinate reductase [Myxococcaceae bacterium]|nr:4-hydroxy-tetrahydrodipicolinate reductase [Myxococcaceae bacterium]
MIRTVITGAGGRMGGTLVRMVQGDAELQLSGATAEPGSPLAGQDAGMVARGSPADIAVVDALEKALDGAQVVIDFTAPKASVAHARLCAERKVAIVIGTTGLEPADKAAIAGYAKQTPIVLAPNTSVGVNVVFQIAGVLARALGDGYDVDILEAHHRMKKDAPSGTALELARVVAEALGRSREDYRMAREGQIGARPAKEIGVQTLRGGDVVGEHTVYFFGAGERVELTHRATNRDQFAKGALRAAKWLAGRPPGLYDMRDVLGFEK